MVSHTRQILTLVIDLAPRDETLAGVHNQFASLSLHEGIGEWSDVTKNRLGLGSDFPLLRYRWSDRRSQPKVIT